MRGRKRHRKKRAYGTRSSRRRTQQALGAIYVTPWFDLGQQFDLTSEIDLVWCPEEKTIRVFASRIIPE